MREVLLMMDVVLLGAVVTGAFLFLRAVWNYELRVANEVNK